MTRDTNIEMVVGGGLGMGDVGWGELVDTNIEMEGSGAGGGQRPAADQRPARIGPRCF